MAESGKRGRGSSASYVASLSDLQLELELTALLGSEPAIRSRAASIYRSTYPCERVSVDTSSGPRELWCKYGLGYSDPMSGHRRGVEYEAVVYRSVLPHPDLATPRCYGAFEVSERASCLVLDFVDGYRSHHSPYTRGLLDICRDLGRFHAAGMQAPRDPQLNTFDATYFTRWATGVDSLLGSGPPRPAVRRFEDSMDTVFDVLCRSPQTIIHGELYPQNVILTETGPVVLDWESAGWGPGVLDLAVLTQGSWDPDLVAECEDAYRNNAGLPDGRTFPHSLAAARVFAAVQLLVHLTDKETDGSAEAQAIEEIGHNLPVALS